MLAGGEGDPLLVLHGAGGNGGWRRWMARLDDRFTIYLLTYPGFGSSDAADRMAVPRQTPRGRASGEAGHD